jgi:molybdopterin synthase sulfur carrier subunit
MKVRVVPFGQLTDIMGKAHLEFDAADTQALQQVLENKYPGLRDRKYAIAVNREIVSANTILPEDAEVALLPPSSGG